MRLSLLFLFALLIVTGCVRHAPIGRGGTATTTAFTTGSESSAPNTDAAPIPAVPPTIVSQPFDQTADYGSNASFTVAADGAPLHYQWQKNGTNLADYANVAGARAATLTLVGAAQSDAAAYSVVVRNAAGAVTSSVATLTVNSIIVFRDDFESGNLGNWAPFRDATGLTNSGAQNHTPGGSHSAGLSSSFNRMYHNLGRKLSGRTKATFWMYDEDGGQARYFGELRAYTGPGHTTYVPPGGMKQLFAIGSYRLTFGTNNTGILAGEQVDSTKYQGRVDRGKNTGWFNLNAPGAPNRSVGWHKFEIDRAANGTNVSFYVDGVLGRTITQVDNMALDCVAIGSAAKQRPDSTEGLGNAWFDDVMVEAFPRTFDWQSLDSAGSGFFDWMKLRETGTNASVSGVTQIITVSQADGPATNSSLGRWANGGSAIHALGERGRLDYLVNAPADDAYRIEVQGHGSSDHNQTADLPLIISIDGEYLGRFLLPFGPGTNGVAHCFTPFIKAGTHTISVYWDNAASHCSLHVRAVRFQSLVGPDGNGNGMKAWVANRLRAQSGIEFAPDTSAVSPVCIEGRGQYLSMMQCTAGASPAEMQAIPIHPGAGHRWYADVPLSPGRQTTIEVSSQNGAWNETNDVAWQVTNLLQANDTRIRKGDSLLLTATPAGASSGIVKITVVGVTNYTTVPSSPVTHRFDQAGTFTVVGAFSGLIKASHLITVKVVDASFDSPAAMVGRQRYWDCTNLPPGVVVEADPRLKIREGLTVPARLGADGRQFALTTDAAEPRYVVARLGANGPILASVAVQGFRLFDSGDTYLRLVHGRQDGSQLIEAAFILSPLLPNLTVGLSVMVSGVTFDDGTVTKTLGLGDFDNLGVCRVRFVRAAGVKTSICHTTKVLDNGVIIGWPSNEK